MVFYSKKPKIKNTMSASAYFVFLGIFFGIISLSAELWRENKKPKEKPKLVILDDNCHGDLAPQKSKIRTVCYVIWISLILAIISTIIGFFLW